MTLKKLLTLTTATAIAVLSTTEPISAQEYQGCFLLDENGVFRDLSFMCNIPAPVISGTVGVDEALLPQAGNTLGRSNGMPNGLVTPSSASGFDSNFGRTNFGSDGGFDVPRFGQSGGLGSYGRPSGSGGSGRCNLPTDRAADGSLCGDRAASRRPGGR